MKFKKLEAQHKLPQIRLFIISNTIKENPEPYTVNSSLVFEVNHKYYTFLESSEPYPVGSGAGFPVFRSKSGL